MPVSSRRTTQWSARDQRPLSQPGFDGPAPPYTSGAPPAAQYGPSGPAYHPIAPGFDEHPMQAQQGWGTTPAATLPFFEAALARSRGGVAPAPPAPSYLPPPDPNHPDIAVGFTRHQSTRQGWHGRSRSPSPEAQTRSWTNPVDDVEKGLLAEDQYAPYHSPYLPLDGKDVDLALPPFQGEISPPRLLSALPSIHRKAGSVDYDPEGDLAGGVTQHFGPAPTGRISRRTHNAAGHRRIKHTATLDDNGFFAVDMPIPTRLAQFLPIKGVAEQETTRYVLARVG